MAWIESHQSLGNHPKTKRLARTLGIPIPQAVGHLHFLWWWAVDYAPDGNLSSYDDGDIADAIMWTGDATEAVNALINARFVDDDGGERFIHDWDEYVGKLLERTNANRERAKRSRLARKNERAESVREPCANGTDTESENDDSVPVPCGATLHYLTLPDTTEPDTTEPDRTPPQLPVAENGGEVAAEPRASAAVAAASPPSGNRANVPYKKIMETFNATCTRLPRIKNIEGSRQKAVAARFKTYGLDEVVRVFKTAQESDFLCGSGEKGFVADFDWLMKTDNFVKVLEGKYANRNEPSPVAARARPPGGNGQASDIDRIIAEEQAKLEGAGL